MIRYMEQIYMKKICYHLTAALELRSDHQPTQKSVFALVAGRAHYTIVTTFTTLLPLNHLYCSRDMRRVPYVRTYVRTSATSFRYKKFV